MHSDPASYNANVDWVVNGKVCSGAVLGQQRCVDGLIRPHRLALLVFFCFLINSDEHTTPSLETVINMDIELKVTD